MLGGYVIIFAGEDPFLKEVFFPCTPNFQELFCRESFMIWNSSLEYYFDWILCKWEDNIFPYNHDNRRIERRAGVYLPPKSKKIDILNGGSKPPPYEKNNIYKRRTHKIKK